MISLTLLYFLKAAVYAAFFVCPQDVEKLVMKIFFYSFLENTLRKSKKHNLLSHRLYQTLD